MIFKNAVIKDFNEKLILLTATPVNNSVFDLYNQLTLITQDQTDFFAGCGIENLKGYFTAVCYHTSAHS